ncbi:MAG TPA: hypothetical protein VHZ99_12920 [Steroidobacteraceae bacterium]|jgi:hypothetical protein|nr:hypothetical protein [Steroidobacteraceae bacterium]
MQKSGLLLLLLLLTLAVGAYAYVLGPIHDWRPSTSAEDWARLGEYVGGISVPLLLIALFANASAIRKLASVQRRQAVHEELMREARSLASDVDQLLLTRPDAERSAAAARKMDLLAAVLSEYVSRGGDTIFLLFYRDRFRAGAQFIREQSVALTTSEWWLASAESDESRRWHF